jgi:hypothetical protein
MYRCPSDFLPEGLEMYQLAMLIQIYPPHHLNGKLVEVWRKCVAPPGITSSAHYK